LPEFNAFAHGYQEDGALAFGMWGEKASHIVVVKSEAGGSEALGIGCEVQFAAEDAGLKLYGAIPAISKAIENRPQVCHEENIHGGIGR
jgi:hypothetical protein